MKNWLAVFVYSVGMVQMAANVNNSTHLISVLNVTTGISAVLTALALVGVIVTVTLIFAASLPVLWPVLIGCACATVIGLIVFLSVRYAGSRCKVPTKEESVFPESNTRNDLTKTVFEENLVPPFNENEFKYNPNIGDPLEEIPAGNVEAAMADPSNPYFPAMVRNCVRILAQISDIPITDAIKLLIKQYNIPPPDPRSGPVKLPPGIDAATLRAWGARGGAAPSSTGGPVLRAPTVDPDTDMRFVENVLPTGTDTSSSLGSLSLFSDNIDPKLKQICGNYFKLMAVYIAIGALIPNHGICLCIETDSYVIKSLCLDKFSFKPKPSYVIANCTNSKFTPKDFYNEAMENGVSANNVLCAHYDDDDDHIQIDKFLGKSGWN
ncbi:MAG: hypothetical protein LBT98_01445 [Puniceicoccales bacterium]|nr:hypothetical protein [Puniceicoccales bacterium]